ncbi:MAG: Cof-type HAD-IIB family hydrolase [Lachnospiraceae bacterium]|nr:Cof-type HAD-IIB family hydrolase [Lachnospiraceae bacterium]
MEQKILFFDIDGTLITDDGKRTFPESAKKAIRMARACGHLTFVNTGRVFVNVDDFIRDAGFDGYVCGCGTYILADGKELLHHKLTNKRCVEIAEKARICGIQGIYEHTEKICYDSHVDTAEARELIEYFRRNYRNIVDDIYSPEFIFDKFTAWYDEKQSRLSEFMNYVSDFNCIMREGSFIEVVPKGFSKATGIQFILDYYGIPLENAYVFGDSNNDLEMLQYVPNSIAMGVCTPEVKAVASYQTSCVNEDGIYRALLHFGVIE